MVKLKNKSKKVNIDSDNIIKIKYPEIGVCGLSCRLCPNYQTNAKSRCLGCKSKDRVAIGCPFITCAIKKKKVEFCWDCEENSICEKWKAHRVSGNKYDSFKCYQKLDDDINFVKKNGIVEFEKNQITRNIILKEMLQEFNEGRSKSYYCIAATIFEIKELKSILKKARNDSKELRIKDKAKILHSLLDEVAERKSYCLKLRKIDR